MAMAFNPHPHLPPSLSSSAQCSKNQALVPGISVPTYPDEPSPKLRPQLPLDISAEATTIPPKELEVYWTATPANRNNDSSPGRSGESFESGRWVPACLINMRTNMRASPTIALRIDSRQPQEMLRLPASAFCGGRIATH